MRKINQNLFVAGQIKPADLKAIAEAGVKTVVNNRPDDEALFQPKTEELAAAAGELGLAYHDIPVPGGQITPDQIAAFTALLDSAEKRVLAFCRSGTRSAMLWALSQAASGDIDEIIQSAAGAGYDFRAYRPMLESMKNSAG